jgi:predicted pyridoxine 5'-phosphate oxidase superfamily flavin-nucleotide-binding protein
MRPVFASSKAALRAFLPVSREMTALTDDMKRVVREQKLGFVATVCPDGTPNVSPKGTITVWDDDHLVFLDLRSPRTIENLARNHAIEINVVDPIRRKGYRFKGEGTVISDGEVFERVLDLFQQERGIPRGRARAAVLMTIERAAPLLSPVYDSGVSEEEVAASWLAHHSALGRRFIRPWSTRSRPKPFRSTSRD